MKNENNVGLLPVNLKIDLKALKDVFNFHILTMHAIFSESDISYSYMMIIRKTVQYKRRRPKGLHLNSIELRTILLLPLVELPQIDF